MKILYIFPHPDDESFGPAPVMSKQRREGHEVYLLTLTRGGATKVRHELGLTVEEMGEVRYKEMLCVAEVLDLTDMSVLDLIDSGLKEMAPRDIESCIKNHILNVKPDILVTHPVHGISGFPDHIVTYSVVKRVFCEMKTIDSAPKRLLFYTITEETAGSMTHFDLSGSTPEEIDCIVTVEERDIEITKQALDCYETYQNTIEESGIKKNMSNKLCFEIFGEKHDPPISGLEEGL